MTDQGRSETSVPEQIRAFLNECAGRLTADVQTPPAAEGAAALARALARSTPRPFTPRALPALDTVHTVDPTPLGRPFVQLAALLPWMPTPRADDGGTDLALAPFEQVRDMGDLTVGIMYVRPGRQYPLHHHPPHELYLTIAGQANWRYGGHEDSARSDPTPPSTTAPGICTRPSPATRRWSRSTCSGTDPSRRTSRAGHRPT